MFVKEKFVEFVEFVKKFFECYVVNIVEFVYVFDFEVFDLFCLYFDECNFDEEWYV